MNFQYLKNHPELFSSVIGIKASQFIKLLNKFSPILDYTQKQKALAKPRKRAIGGGRKPLFDSDAKKLFFILFYYKVYPTFRLAQALFGLDKKNIQYWKEYLEPILKKTLSYELQLPKVRANCLNHVFDVCPDLKEFITDATERPVARPKKQNKQKPFFSGKSKNHTVKTSTYINPKSKRILAITKTYAGKTHDKTIMEDDPLMLKLPPKSTGLGDLAYQGIKGWHPLLTFIHPQKKAKRKELSSEGKQINKTISSIRVKIEHVFAYMKHFNILRHDFRNKLPHPEVLDKVHLPFFNIACIYNFCLSNK